MPPRARKNVASTGASSRQSKSKPGASRHTPKSKEIEEQEMVEQLEREEAMEGDRPRRKRMARRFPPMRKAAMHDSVENEENGENKEEDENDDNSEVQAEIEKHERGVAERENLARRGRMEEEDDDQMKQNRRAPTKRKATKRKRDEDDQDEKPAEKPKAKKPRSAPQKDAAQDEAPEKAPAPKKTRASKAPPKKRAEKPASRSVSRVRGFGARGAAINKVPSAVFDVFVFGEGSSGELGLGSKKHEGKKPIDVKRPRINHNLRGIVAIACGGMHCIALTSERTVLTWGVNDDKALGRDTLWDGGTRDIDEEDSEMDGDDTGVNPNESTPNEVDLSVLPEGTNISQVAATDSASFILTDDGWVYGWGTFRGSDGIIGFGEGVRTQSTPTIIPGLKGIVQLACGSNHVLALDLSGKVFTWGSGGQFQLGRKPLSRLGGPSAGLSPQACGKFTKKHRAVFVGAGSYHSFYIDSEDRVWAWGLNNYAQTGLNDNTGEDDAMVLQPQVIQSLEDYKVSQIVGGEHHSVACTTDGKLLTWGRVDGHQVGQPSALYTEENAIFDDNGKPRILAQPTAIDGIKVKFVAAGTDTSFAVDEAGKVYSWGFSANYQTGQGTTDDIEVPTMIDNTAIRDRRIIWAGAGGQFSVIAAAADDRLPNGH
ncbi:GDP/GTP exchange factor [Hypoxylon cercidicola]|nr:GDP/GTP exchange factor [Hypoxylon cercidicola]